MKKFLLLAALLSTLPAYAQYAPWHDQVLVNSFGIKPGAFASVTVCTNQACSPSVANIYGNQTGAGGTIANPLTADQNGNFSFWAASGFYFITAQAAGISLQGYWVCVGGCGSGGGGGGGTGTVTSFSSGGLTDLFNTNVSNPSTTPALTFSKTSQGASLFYATPCGATGFPTWRALCAQDLPAVTKREYMVFAGCTNGLGASAWDLPASGGMTAACVTDGTNGTVQGVLQAAHSTLAYYSLGIEGDFTAFVNADIWFTSIDTTQGHTIQFTLATACTGPGGTVADTPAYNPTQNFATVTIPSSAVSGGAYHATLTGVTATTCTANDILHIKLARSSSDTSTDTAVQLTGTMILSFQGTLN